MFGFVLSLVKEELRGGGKPRRSEGSWPGADPETSATRTEASVNVTQTEPPKANRHTGSSSMRICKLDISRSIRRSDPIQVLQ